jgi:peptide/nickel transport system permease protein
MTRYVIYRLLLMIPTLLLISIISFVVIQLPPGDVIDTQISELMAGGADVSQEQIEALQKMYHLDVSMPKRYWLWITGIVFRWDFGYSIELQQPVSELIGERIGLTIVVAVASLLLTWALALPIGIVSAVKQYSWLDYISTAMAMLGMAIPQFMLALLVMWGAFRWFGVSIGGLFSPEFVNAPWSVARVLDMLSRLWVPMVVLGVGGTAGMVRIMRANLLDELKKPYVVTARAKGMRPWRMILKYPVRIAINPFISGIGGILPMLFSGSAIVSVVIGLPTTGPLLLDALMNQDMYLAGSFILILSTLSVVGVLLSDLALAAVDPRIRYD